MSSHSYVRRSAAIAPVTGVEASSQHSIDDAERSGRRAHRFRRPAARPRRRRQPRDHYNKREALAGYLFISPWIIGFLVFTAGAMIYSLYISFSSYNLATNTARPIGFDNYANLFSDPRVGVALGNTLFYAVLAVPLEIVVALFLAMLLNRVGRGAGVFRTLYYLPKMTPAVATASMFFLLLNGNNGAVNQFLRLFGIQGPQWLVDPAWVKPSIVLMTLWTVAGTMVIFLAALKNVPVGGFAAVKSFTDSFDTFGDDNQYVKGQVGAQINAQWYPNVLSPYVDQLQLEAVPFRNADGEPFSVASGTAFVIPVGAKNPAAACAWMVNLTSDDAWDAAGDARGETRAKDGGINTGLFTGSPDADKALRDTWVKPSGNADFDQVISAYYDVVDYGQSFGSSPAGQEIQNELNNAITAALLGDKTPEQALANAQKAAMRAYENATAG